MEDRIQYTLRFSTRRHWYYTPHGPAKGIPKDVTPVTPGYIGDGEKTLQPGQFGKVRQETPRRQINERTTARYAVSDGSVKNGKGTFGWVKGNFTQTLEQGQGQVDGTTGLITSYRAEAQGLADMIHSGGITKDTQIYLDNTAVVGKVNRKNQLHPLHPEWDILEPTRKKVQKDNLKVQHVKGHQSLTTPTLTRQARLNHTADKLAEEAHQKETRPGVQLPGYKIRLYILGDPVTTKLEPEILWAATTPEIAEYYQKRHKWTNETMDTIAWTAHEKAIKKLKISQQRTIHKFQHDWLPTQHNLHKRYNTRQTCPFCNQTENAMHIIQCKSRIITQNSFYRAMKEKLQELHTEPSLQTIFLTMIQGRQTIRSHSEEYYEWTSQLLEEQSKIGNDKLWKGYITQTWGDIQEHHYQQTHQPHHYTGTTWTHRVITLLYNRVLQAWTDRNTAIYDKEEKKSAEKQYLQQQTTYLYRKHKHTKGILPQLFHRNHKQLMDSSTRYLRRWLQIMQPIDKHYEVEKKRRQGQDIRRYLPMQERPPEINPTSNFEPDHVYQ